MATVTVKMKSLLKEWDTIKQQIAEIEAPLKPLKERESLIRKELATHFQDVVEGSKNVIPLANGFSLKLTHKVSRSVDETAFKALHKDLVEAKVPMDILFREVHELEKAVYSKLPAESKTLVDQVLLAKPDAPTIELVPPKPAK